MTTLDVKMSQLQTAVEPYPVVKSLRSTPSSRTGCASGSSSRSRWRSSIAGGRQTAVSGDGTLLHDVTPASVAADDLARSPARRDTSDRLRPDRGAAAGRGAVPAARQSRTRSRTGPPTGWSAQLRAGPSIYFGDSSQLEAKWTAAAEVLADSRSAGAAYVDVTDPSRPVAGAVATSSTAGASATGGTSTAGASTTGAPASTAGASTAAVSASTATTPVPSGALRPEAKPQVEG